MSQTCTEHIFHTIEFEFDGHEWTANFAILGHYNIVMDRTVTALSRKAQSDFRDPQFIGLATALLMEHAKTRSKSVDTWPALYAHCQSDAELLDFVSSLEKALAVSATSSTLTMARTLCIQFTPQMATILNFHKNFVTNTLFTPALDDY